MQSLDSAIHRINPHPAVLEVFLGGKHCWFSFVFQCGACSGSFQSFVLRHIASYYVIRHCITSEHPSSTPRNYNWANQLRYPPLPSSEACLCCGEAGEKEKESARGTMGRGKREQRIFAFSLFPSPPARFPFVFSIIAMFIEIPSWSLCGGERLSTL